jgi:hypothetical protein
MGALNALPQLHEWAIKKPPLSAAGSWFLFFRRWIRQQTSFSHLQAVIARKVHHEIPGHDVVFAQIVVHDHALDTGQRGGNAPRGVTQVAARRGAAGTKRAHDPCQSLGPITGSEWLAILGDALDKNFFGRVANHRIEVCVS